VSGPYQRKVRVAFTEHQAAALIALHLAVLHDNQEAVQAIAGIPRLSQILARAEQKLRLAYLSTRHANRDKEPGTFPRHGRSAEVSGTGDPA